MENLHVYKNWYWNEDRSIREAIHWEILKDTGAKRHSVDFILEGKGVGPLPTRFYRIGDFKFLIGQIKERFVNNEHEPSWHFFRSVAYLRFTDNGKPADLKDMFSQQIYGWDLVFDIDNKPFKKWWREIIKTDEYPLSNPDILKRIKDSLPEVWTEAELIRKFLDKWKVPFILNFSGSGFRIVVEWEDLKNFFSLDQFAYSGEFIKWILEKIKLEQQFINKNFQFHYFGEIQTGYCLTRALFTIHPISKLVSFPLNDDEFKNFDIEKVKPSYLINNLQIPKMRSSFNKKRAGSFEAIFNEFKKSNHFKASNEEKKTNKYQEIKDYIKGMISQLPKDEKENLLADLQEDSFLEKEVR